MFYIIVCIIIKKTLCYCSTLEIWFVPAGWLACPSFLKNEGKTLHSSFLVSFFFTIALA